MSDPRKSEPFRKPNDVADELGIARWKLRRAIKAGLVPYYSILDGSRLVLLSEVRECLERSRVGGVQ